MLTKADIKLIRSLKVKKYRKNNAAFIAEGDKIVSELLFSDYEIQAIYCLQEWVDTYQGSLRSYKERLHIINSKQLSQISLLKTPNQVLALAKIPTTNIETKYFENSYSLVLDKIKDPGNLGTIIRIADWFGFQQIICSPDSVDVYNAKVIQAAMGSAFRIKCVYQDLSRLFEQYKDIPVYGALLGGETLYKTKIAPNGFILIGNESKGIQSTLKPYIDHAIEIPQYGQAESLNAAVATGIICAEFRKFLT